MCLNSDLKCAKRPMDVLFKKHRSPARHTWCPQDSRHFLKALPRFLHNFKSLYIIRFKSSFFSGTSNKWLTRREPSSGKAPPPLEPAEKVLNVKFQKSCGKKTFSVGTFPLRQPPYSRRISTNYSVCGNLLPHTYSNLRHFTPVSMNHVQGFPGGSGFSCREDMTVLWVSAICLRRRAILKPAKHLTQLKFHHFPLARRRVIVKPKRDRHTLSSMQENPASPRGKQLSGSRNGREMNIKNRGQKS